MRLRILKAVTKCVPSKAPLCVRAAVAVAWVHAVQRAYPMPRI